MANLSELILVLYFGAQSQTFIGPVYICRTLYTKDTLVTHIIFTVKIQLNPLITRITTTVYTHLILRWDGILVMCLGFLGMYNLLP